MVAEETGSGLFDFKSTSKPIADPMTDNTVKLINESRLPTYPWMERHYLWCTH
jgi:hypothetical protein